MSTELTLAAALRDATSTSDDSRSVAIRNLAPALLKEVSQRAPSFEAWTAHARGTQVRDTLRHAVSHDPVSMTRGLAAIGLGQLGDAWLLEKVGPWIDHDGDEGEVVFLREAAIIALSFVGSAAPSDASLRLGVLGRLRMAMTSPHADVRFQAAMGLAEVAGEEAEGELCRALASESVPGVRENLVAALSTFDPPPPRSCEALAQLLAGDDADEPIGFMAAMALCAARRPEALPRLAAGLRRREERDDALEALAVLSQHVDEATTDTIRRIASSLWTPSVTKVRAAYALARLHPTEGLARLARLSWHPRRAVREAVADAQAALDTLKDREVRAREEGT